MPFSIRSRAGRLLVCAGAFVLLAQSARALPPGFTDLTLPSPAVTDYEFFGRSVASLGSRLVVGAPGTSLAPLTTLPGRVYVLNLDGSVSLTIQNPTPASNDEFGAAIAVAGGNLVIGAPFDDTVASNAGAAYLIDGSSGALLQTLLVPGSGSNSQCGHAVAALGTDALVMCDGVYRFDGTTGALVRHYTAPGCLGGLGLATIGGDVLSAGYGGPVCRFDGATGAVVQTYADPEPGLLGAFGSSIGVDGNTVVVGGEGFSGVRESMYVFDGATGVLLQTIRGPYYGSPYNAGFGTSVAAADGVLVGSGWNSTRFYDSASYAFLGEWQPDDVRRAASRDTVTAVFDSGFVVWTDVRHPNTGRGTITVIDRCGNGVQSPAEQCDDGNTTSGDGCSAACRRELCPALTWPITLGCHSIDPHGASSVTLQRKSTGNWSLNGDRFIWKWKGAGSVGDFGDPTAGATYQVCFYDDLFGTPDLRLDFAIPSDQCAGKPCWRRKGVDGFVYGDPDHTPSGIDNVVILSKSGRAKITISGDGRRLGLPDLLGTDNRFPFNFGWAVVLVESSSGQCWSAGSGAFRNQRGKFKGSAHGS